MTGRRAVVALGLMVSVALLWWALRDVSAAELWARLRAADPWLLAASVAVATGSFVLRAFRWHALLEAALPRSSFLSRFRAVCIGFMGNNLLPLRLGEFARIYTLARTEPIGMSATFASLVLERLFDGMLLVLLLFLALATPELTGRGPALVRNAPAIAAGLVALGLTVLWLAALFPERLIGWFRHRLMRPFPDGWARRLTGLVTSFIAGLGALRRPGTFARVLGWTAVIWVWNAVSFWLGFLAFDIRAPGFAGAVFLQSLIALAVSLPSGPGFFGPFEAAARLGLGLYGVEPSQIIAFAAGYHILTFIPVTVLGLWYLHRLGLTWAEVGHSEEVVEAAVERAGEGGGD